ncbi:MAG: aminotransferase class I/II-fold pyridoxal phosphate-dependent enzyme [Alphaproteobacteria bacterium]|nr:aminotransferase class I/II-fold pyridoxal phosphate-dependent enzyme [Alphaproteobacteria bacterium]
MSNKPTPSRATLAAQALGWSDEKTRGLVPPIYTSTTYLRDPDGGYRSGRIYTRADNPSFDLPEAMITTLEGGAGSLVYSSGMAAATAVFMNLQPGDHVIAPNIMYWGLRNWLKTSAIEWGLDVDFVDGEDSEAFAKCLRKDQTKIVWIETPANPTWAISDIAAIAEIAHSAGARLAVDSTVATPVLTRPIEHGADIVMHSATKYLNGHSDVLAGTLTTAQSDDFWERLVNRRASAGATLGPFEAWLLVRGMRTLYLRVERACRTAQRLAEHFSGHAKISRVYYPGLPGHPGHDIAARQMTGGFGGMLSVSVEGGMKAAVAVAAKTKLWHRATSLGGVESLIEHRASIEGPDSPVPPDLLRLSVGIEDPDDLIADLEQAL